MILEIKNGCFGYPKQDIILPDINLSLEEGHSNLRSQRYRKDHTIKMHHWSAPLERGCDFSVRAGHQNIKTKGIVEQCLLHSAEPRFCFFLHRTGNGHARPLFASWRF